MNLNYGEIKLAVARKCNDISDDGKSIAGECINQIQEVIDEAHLWSFFKNNTETITMVAGTSTYDLPTDFTHLVKVWYYDSEYKILQPLDDDEEYRYTDKTKGTPKYFRLIGAWSSDVAIPQIEISPAPNAAFVSSHSSISVEMSEGFSELALDATYPAFPNRFAKLIEWGASALMVAGQGDYAAQKSFQATFDTMLKMKVEQDLKRYETTVYVPTGARKTFEELKWEVSRLVGDTTAKGQVLAGESINHIIEVMDESHFWSFFKDNQQSIELVGGQGNYDLPDDFTHLVKLWYYDSGYQILRPATDDEEYRYGSEVAGTPELFRLIGGLDSPTAKPQVQITPPPSIDFVTDRPRLELEMVKGFDKLLLDDSYPAFPDRFSKVIEWGAAALLSTDADTVAKFQAQYEAALKLKINQDQTRYEDTVYIPTASRMSFGELKWAVAFMAGDTSAKGQALAGTCINQIQLRIQRKRKWSFLVDRDSTITMESGTGIYDLPDDFSQISQVYYKNLDDRPMMIDPASDWTYFRYINEGDPDEPYLYRLLSLGSNRKLRILLGPPPNASFISTYGATLYLEQEAEVSQLTSDTDYTSWPDDFRTCIEAGAALLMITAMGGDTNKASTFGALFQSELLDLSGADAMRYNKMFAFTPALGGTPRPWARGVRSDYGRSW